MTTPTTDSGTLPTRQPKPTSFMDWFQINSRWVGLGAVAVALAGAVAWYVPHQKALAAENADKMLLAAKQSLNSGNAQLAESDLRKVADRYAGTASGAEAGMLLGQLRLDRGDASGAVSWLQELASKAKGPSEPAVRGLLGDALAQANKPADAAAEYEKAAGLSNMPGEKAMLQIKAAYAYMNGGKNAEAKKLFQALAASPESPALAAEAKVRLGELEAAAKG